MNSGQIPPTPSPTTEQGSDGVVSQKIASVGVEGRSDDACPPGALERWTVSPRAYRRFTFAALLLLGIIVLTGAAVRLTGSGLGCEDWPRCSDTEVIGELSGAKGIEQANRLPG